MRWLTALAFAFLLAIPANAQQAQPRADSGQMRMLDNTYVPGGGLGNVGAGAPGAGLQGYSSTPTTPPPPPAPTATWIYGTPVTHHCSERTYPWCDALSTASCVGEACPAAGRAGCWFYCNTSLLDGYGVCPAPGVQSASGPGAMGFTFQNTCGG